MPGSALILGMLPMVRQHGAQPRAGTGCTLREPGRGATGLGAPSRGSPLYMPSLQLTPAGGRGGLILPFCSKEGFAMRPHPPGSGLSRGRMGLTPHFRHVKGRASLSVIS